MPRKTALLVCPGRGSYNQGELRYLQHHHADKNAMMDVIDAQRKENKQPTIRELDGAARFDPGVHTRSDNASSLIYTCAYADFLAIDQSQYEIVAITGNSMGWYIALACAAALSQVEAMQLINQMGNLMQKQPGGQVIIPLLDDAWQAIPGRLGKLNATIERINQLESCMLFDSILLGGYRIVAGNDAALKQLQQSFKLANVVPMRLPNHAAFHSPLMQDASNQAREILTASLFRPPAIPLIDGCGSIWQPLSSDTVELWDYTLGHQITQPYNFGRAIQNAVREFAPDVLINLGPGNTLGGATAQALVEINWAGMHTKQDFIDRQQSNSILLSMGLSEQRDLVTA